MKTIAQFIVRLFIMPNSPEYFRNWRKRNPEKARAIKARFKARHPDRVREHARRSALRRSGWTLEEHNRRFEEQDGICANIYCLNVATTHDHDHETGLMRFLLCRECNLALGMLHDDIQRIRGLLKLMENYNS